MPNVYFLFTTHTGFTSVSELVAGTTGAVRSLFLLKQALTEGDQPFVQFGGER